MNKIILILFTFFIFSTFTSAHASQGLISVKSTYTFDETLERLENTLKNKNMTLFARIDHSAGAKNVGKTLDPNTVIIFGNPNVGTLLMQSNPAAGIDLPLKLLIWTDDNQQVWVTYNDPAYLVDRHSITDHHELVEKMQRAMLAITSEITAE